ncbi:hypothetical protein DNFV4_04009 [Nitrospira tepida]|uniref:Uncharacterized protein n=1 Tax=Nitrospira tepida TaxID=2973512 RepID=A0AA86N2I7_9BACT|nr:hypothetical protein [Nitrospira tepida]CAI4033568.1 hypothetical protein DNFV4_04009 [Nitrospira tepida]
MAAFGVPVNNKTAPDGLPKDRPAEGQFCDPHRSLTALAAEDPILFRRNATGAASTGSARAGAGGRTPLLPGDSTD